MNFLFIAAAECTGDATATLRGERKEHAVLQHELVQGLAASLVVEGRGRGKGNVVLVEADALHLEFVIESEPPPPCLARVLIGMSRPQTIKKVLELSATLGVQELHFAPGERGEKSYRSSTVFGPESIRQHLIKGLEQGGEWHLPRVVLHTHLRKALAEVAPLDTTGGSRERRLLADTGSDYSDRLSPKSVSSGNSVLLCVGPEAGWSDEERALILSRGFSSISLGSRIMRVEQALGFFLGQIALVSGAAAAT